MAANPEKLKVAVVGASGRMGRSVLLAVSNAPGACIVGALERSGLSCIGADTGLLAGTENNGIFVTDDPGRAFLDADAVIDFTIPKATLAFAEHIKETNAAHIIGTTGFSADEQTALATFADQTTIVKSGNMSLGVNILAALVKKAAASLDESFDIEVLEMHHRSKIDAPSGTALLLGDAAAKGREISLEEHSVRSRDGITGARNTGDIGFATLRGGSVIGEHSVIFAGPAERIVLTHKAEDRNLFAAGALKAAFWAKGTKPGLYSMDDVLGLNE